MGQILHQCRPNDISGSIDTKRISRPTKIKMETLDIILPFPIHECWFRIINKDLLSFDTTLSKEDVVNRVIKSYKLKGANYQGLFDLKAKILNRLQKYQLKYKEDFWEQCEPIFFNNYNRIDTLQEIRAALKCIIDTFYSGYINRYQEWECEAYNYYYPKYSETSNLLELWEDDFVITPEEIEYFLETTSKMYLDIAAQHEREEDDYNEQLRRKYGY
jgi:hypothetical protein